MPPLRTPKFIAHSTNANRSFKQPLVLNHGDSCTRQHARPQPYSTRIIRPHATGATFTIPNDLVDKANLVELDAAVREMKDAIRLKKFLLFCEELWISNDSPLLASEDLLAAWASSYVGRSSGETAGARISAIKKEHRRQAIPWSGGEKIMKGIKEMRPASSFRIRRAPVTIDMLTDLDRGLKRTSGLDNCVRAICLLSFFSQLCSGDLLPPSEDLSKFNPRHHATFSDIAESTAESGACCLHLPWSKTEKARGEDVWIPRQEAPLDPIRAIHKHFIKNNLEINHPISAYRNEHGKLVTLTRSKFIQRINHILRATNKGYHRITGHCFRIGGSTFYLASGVPLDVVKKFGRWRSRAFLEYLHYLDYLGALHIEMLPLRPKA